MKSYVGAWFEKVAGSCLSYIGPGVIYIGIHGGRFMELSNAFFGHRTGFLGSHVESPDEHRHCEEMGEETTPLYCDSDKTSNDASGYTIADSWFIRQVKNMIWYTLGMPFWCAMAQRGQRCLTSHVTELALRTPHPIRIGNVRFARAMISSGDTRVVMLKHKPGTTGEDTSPTRDTFVNTKLLRADSLPRGHDSLRTSDGAIVALPPLTTQQKTFVDTMKDAEKGNYDSINQRIGAMARRQKEEEKLALEDDPQGNPPTRVDFFIAAFYVIFGIIAMAAGLLSIFI